MVAMVYKNVDKISKSSVKSIKKLYSQWTCSWFATHGVQMKMSSLTLPKTGWLCASRTCCWSISFSWRRIGWLCWRSAFCSQDAKQPHSHLHPRCSQVLSKLYSKYVCVLLFKNDLTWTDKVQRSISIRHTDPPAVACTSLQSGALLLQAAVLEPLPHDFQNNLGIRKYAYSWDSPTDTWSSHEFTQFQVKKMQTWKHLPPPVQLASQHFQPRSAVEAVVPSY